MELKLSINMLIKVKIYISRGMKIEKSILFLILREDQLSCLLNDNKAYFMFHISYLDTKE